MYKEMLLLCHPTVNLIQNVTVGIVMCYRAYFLLVVASHVHMNCLQDVNVIYTLRKNGFTQ